MCEAGYIMKVCVIRDDLQGHSVMGRIRGFIFLCGLLVAFSASASAALPASLQLAVQSGWKVEKHFAATSGLTGWVLSRSGRYTVVFTTADGKALITGAVLDATGKNLTEEYSKKYIPKPDLSKFWPRLATTPYIVEGAKGKDVKFVLYAFEDPNCIFCHMTWLAFQPYEKVGLQVRWIPVAFLRKNSAGKDAAIMLAPDPEAAFRAHHKAWVSEDSGGIAPVPVPANIRAEIVRDNQLMNAMGIRGTPGIVYRDKKGRVVVKSGMPRLSEIPRMTGLPEQKIDDPALKRFP